ncbi:hypothetical protein [Flavobacterium sp.]|uniref:hypothetical protein n=1 Tax=Flavobacterium sp. TaxID=239 RepID=UPI002620D1DB|nr:hypothetical protein [Flavobacterium sp.]
MKTRGGKIMSIQIVLLLFYLTSFGQDENALVGKWKNETDASKTSEFFKAADGLYYGKIATDASEPSGVGKIVMKKLKYDPKEKNFKGIMAPPDKKIELDVTITFITADKIKVVGKKLLFSKVFYFSKIKK